MNLWIFDHFIFCSVFDNLGGPSWAHFKGVPRFWECQNQVLSAMEVVHQHWIGVFHMLEDLLEPCFPVDWPRDLLYEAIASFLPYCALHCDNVKATIPGYPPWISLLHILKMDHAIKIRQINEIPNKVQCWMYLNHNNGNLVSVQHFQKYFVDINNFVLVLLVLPATGNRLRRLNQKRALTIIQLGSETHFFKYFL